jgi:hypothetical protein
MALLPPTRNGAVVITGAVLNVASTAAFQPLRANAAQQESALTRSSSG